MTGTTIFVYMGKEILQIVYYTLINYYNTCNVHVTRSPPLEPNAVTGIPVMVGMVLDRFKISAANALVKIAPEASILSQ